LNCDASIPDNMAADYMNLLKQEVNVPHSFLSDAKFKRLKREGRQFYQWAKTVYIL